MSSVLARIDFNKIFSELERVKARVVGIQLPDGLKFRTKEIVERFEEKYETIISSSHAFGACDIDISLLDVVDILVHFAHTPVIELERVIYAPYFYDYSFERIKKYLGMIEDRRIALAGTAQYAWKFPELKEFLEEEGFIVELGKPSGRIKLPGQILGCNYSVLRETTSNILFIGDGLFHPRGAAIYTGRRVYRYNPLTDEFGEVEEEVEKFRKERCFQISRALQRLDEGVGIAVSSKPGQNRLLLAKKLKLKAIGRGIEAHIIYFDDLSPEKLLNFPFGFYVNTACPRITYEDYKRYEKPVLTPSEFELVVKGKDFGELKVDELF
jgi:2-(3-amino-3-carboxypropyl)histidine synthase